MYYVDTLTGNIYAVNNEDYWLDAKAYIQIEPASKETHARLWYGWNKFAQGGINDAGLFFDVAVTPQQPMPKGYQFSDKKNLGDMILANCGTVEEAINYLEKHKVALDKGHFLFGDSTGNATVVEWVDGQKHLVPMKNNKLVITNFLLTDTAAGNYPCYRYNSIQQRVDSLEASGKPITLLNLGNTFGGAAQPPQANEEGRMGGTVYTSFINITNMEFFLVYHLDNSKVTKLNLKEVFDENKKRKIKLE